MKNFEQYIDTLEDKIKAAYEAGLTVEEAERAAAEFLRAQMVISAELRKADLDARMRKQGLKAVRGAVYQVEATKSEKKPTEAMLAAILDTDQMIAGEQTAYDEVETKTAELERLYNIFREAHIYMRGIAKGSM